MTKRTCAKYDLDTAMLDGLFESTRKIRRKDKEVLLRAVEGWRHYRDQDTGTEYRDSVYIRLLVPEALGVGAESILLAILKLAGDRPLQIEPQQPCIPLLLEPEGCAQEKIAGAVVASEYELMRLAGMGDGKKDYQILRRTLEMMSIIAVHYNNKITRWRGSDWFLKYRGHEDGRLMIQVNWRLAGAIFGNYLYADVDLEERNCLRRDPSKTLHRWLSGHIWYGCNSYLLLPTLVNHTWTETATPTTQRKRIQRMRREILPEIGELADWTVTLDESERGATIERAQAGAN